MTFARFPHRRSQSRVFHRTTPYTPRAVSNMSKCVELPVEVFITARSVPMPQLHYTELFHSKESQSYLEWQQSLPRTTHSPPQTLAAAQRLPGMCPGA